MVKKWLMLIHQVNNLNCSKNVNPAWLAGFTVWKHLFFLILIYCVNCCVLDDSKESVVPNTSKVLKRKQITTRERLEFKEKELFPIRQRY